MKYEKYIDKTVYICYNNTIETVSILNSEELRHEYLPLLGRRFGRPLRSR